MCSEYSHRTKKTEVMLVAFLGLAVTFHQLSWPENLAPVTQLSWCSTHVLMSGSAPSVSRNVFRFVILRREAIKKAKRRRRWKMGAECCKSVEQRADAHWKGHKQSAKINQQLRTVQWTKIGDALYWIWIQRRRDLRVRFWCIQCGLWIWSLWKLEGAAKIIFWKQWAGLSGKVSV